ncbi:MAG: MBOAT family O-acyltransferase [Acidobacteriota bacterium]
MLFNTWQFGLFFVVVFAIYHTLSVRPQNVLLLLASYFFYGCWDYRFLGLIFVSTAVDFTTSLYMEGAGPRRRRILLWTSVFTNLGILGVFKYFNFFVDSASGLLEGLGFQAHLPILRIVLPVGISFYTFQTMAYTIDVYRRKLKPTRDLLLFAVYVSYFPQLVAGPIERPQHLLPQFSAPRRVGTAQLASGALLVLIGLVRKVVIADVVAPEVDAAFGDPLNVTSLHLLRAVLLFSLQIYGDFAGYSDIARGISRMLGIELMRNFRHPYFARSITEFWRRWHISHSTWLRDYLYIPLGGNRGPRWFVYRNLMLTMLLGGLWHGAAWTFVAWGGLHGLGLVLHKIWQGRRSRVAPGPPGSLVTGLQIACSWAATMALVGIAWIFFRAPGFHAAWQVITGIVSLRGFTDTSLAFWSLPFSRMALVLFLDVPQFLAGDDAAILGWPWPVRGLSYAGLVMALVLLRREISVPFIYFQF